MRDYHEIGSTPSSEECAQVWSEDYVERSKRECRAFINQIRRQLGPEPAGARLRIKSNDHDFGVYHEVVCHFDTDIPESREYAFRCETDVSEGWDTEARKELGL